MKNKFLTFIIILLIYPHLLHADFRVENWMCKVIAPDEVEIMPAKYTGFLRDTVIVPKIVIHKEKKYQVKGLSDYGFQVHKMIKVILPDELEYIGKGAFRGCHELVSINIPPKVTKIEDDVFNGCFGLTDIKFHSHLTYIGKSAFSFCSKLSDIRLPENLTHIGEDAFFHSGMRSVYIPEKLSFIGENVFTGCEKLESFTVSGKNRFFTTREGVLFDKSGTIFLSYPGGRKGAYQIPAGTKEIGESAFNFFRSVWYSVFSFPSSRITQKNGSGFIE